MSIFQDVLWRELGNVHRLGDPATLRRNILGSRYLLETYNLKGLLKGHTGCVNSVLFSDNGGFIYTGSDDTHVNIYETESLKLVETLVTVHTNNIFYARDIPGTDMNVLLTCAADGRIVLTNMATKAARRLHRHRGRAHRIALVPFENNQFYSCGEDGACCLFDIRDHASTMFRTEDGVSALDEDVFAPAMTTVFKNNRGSTCSIYTVGVNPLCCYQVAVGGSSNHISLYDSRKFTDPVSYLCPQSLASSAAHVTGLKYDHTGEMLIGSYNDDDVYSFMVNEDAITSRRRPPGRDRTRADSTDGTDVATATASASATGTTPAPDSTGYYRRYTGHRNNNTVKQVVFMGGRSDFVISGSDCGNIFIWDTHSAEVVQMLKADEVGAINCLAPHPTLPILATSGLETDAKIWQPSGHHKPIAEGTEKKKDLTRTASRNAERNQRDAYSTSLMSLLMNLMNRRDAPLHGDSDSDSNSDGDDDDNDGEEEEEGSEEREESENEGGDGDGDGDDGSGTSYSSQWSDGSDPQGEDEGEEEEFNHEPEEEAMDAGTGGEGVVAAATATTATTGGSSGRDRWTRRPAPALPVTDATDPPGVVPAAGEGTRRHHRHTRTRRSRLLPAPREPAEEEEKEEHEVEGEEGDEVGVGPFSMQDLASGRVGIVIDGVEVPFAHLVRLMPALLGRRRRSPSDTGEEEQEEQEEEEEEGEG